MLRLLHDVKTAALWRFLGFTIMVTALVLVALHPAEAARKKSHSHIPADRYASIVIDAETGYALSEKNADKKLYPASLTKMMTLYLTFDALESGLLRKSTRLPVSRRAAVQEPSVLALDPGSSIRAEDAILGLVTKSANDAAVVLAEAIGGSEARFAEMMTVKAQELGMTNTRFMNASGLHNPQQVSTARDMATLGRALIYNHPRNYGYFSTPSFFWAGKQFDNHNKLMTSYAGMDGIKTGYVHQSGFNLVASAVRSNHRLIGVVFGGRTAKSRNATMTDLLDTGFMRRRDTRIASIIEQRGRTALPVRKPVSDLERTVIASAISSVSPSAGSGKKSLRSDASLLEEEGDTSADFSATTAPHALFDSLKPRPMNTTPLKEWTVADAGPAGDWTVQVGSYASHEAGMQALHTARKKLPSQVTGSSRYVIAPLMTNRGMIYRARLSGMEKGAATKACRLLKGSCLILASR